MSKVTIIGGGGIRTPLVVYGLAQAQAELGLREIALYDLDVERVSLIAALSRAIVQQDGVDITITTPTQLEAAVAGASFVISSIRVGGIAERGWIQGGQCTLFRYDQD